MINKLTALDGATAAVADPARGVLWIVTATGAALWSWDVAAQSLVRHTALAARPTGVALSADGQRVVVTADDGSITVVAAEDPEGGATPLGHSPSGGLGQVATTVPITGAGYALAVSESKGALLSARLSDGNVRTVVALDGITGVATDARTTWAAATVLGVGSLVSVVTAPTGAATPVLANGLLPTGHVTRSPDSGVVLVAHPGAARLSGYRIDDRTVTTYALDPAIVPGTLVEAHLLDDGRCFIVTDEVLAVADDIADLGQRPRLFPPGDPLFVGSWVPLQYDLSGTDLTDDDVSFVVADDPDAAFISHTSFATSAGRKVPLLAAGIVLGTFTVQMIETATGMELDSAPFEVTDHWLELDHGPSRMYAGPNAPAPAPTSGGAGPQNLGTQAHTGRWTLGLLLVNTSDGAYPAADLPAARKAMLDEVQDGVSYNGVTRSARLYYEELSRWDPNTGRGLTVQAYNNRVYGPVDLPDSWGTYFAQTVDAAGTVTDARWAPKGATVQTVVSRALAQNVLTTADLAAIDVLVIIPRSPDATGNSTRYAWPYAGAGVTVTVGPKATDQQTFAFMYMSPDFAAHDGRQVHTAVCHELGHTLGLPDLYQFPSYTPDIVNRLVGDWDIMCGADDTLGHYSLSNRMRQGWVDAGHIECIGLAGLGHLDKSYTLYAAELGAPPSGLRRGIELRLGDGWNTYVEYRAKQSGQVGDNLIQDKRVVITDVTSDTFATPISRPPIVLVHNDADGDGPVLPSGKDYQDTDPPTQMKLVVRVVSTTADRAEVHLTYDAGGRADPGIRPWSGAPNWQSPDIEVRNDRSKADPARWGNTPWAGNMNTVVAKIRNGGDKLAKGVRVNLFVTEFTTGDGPWMLLGTDTHDVPAGTTVEFSAAWVPPTEGHFCVIARIELYVDPDLAGAFETNIYNNEARSNYSRFVSASSSPANRVGTQVLLANPFDQPTIVTADVRQTHDRHRVWVDHQWLRVEGGQSLPVHVFDEADVGDDPDGADWERLSVDNVVSVQGWATRPFAAACLAPSLTGGAALGVGAGRTTTIRFEEAHRAWARGTVAFNDGSPVANGVVLLVLSEVDDTGAVDPFGARVTGRAQVHNGQFADEWPGLNAEHGQIVGHFLGGFAAAPSDSEPVPVTS